MIAQLKPSEPRSASLNKSSFIDLTQLFKACGEELRLEILRVMQADSFGVSELCFLFELRQSAISHHLKVLSEANLVATRKEANFIFYRRNIFSDDGDRSLLINTFFCSLDALPISEKLASRLKTLQRQRVNNSKIFFQNNSDRFAVQRDLIAGYSHYGEIVASTLHNVSKPSNNVAVEIGPGDGAFLIELSPHFRKIIAVDNSEAMLASAKQFARDNSISNVQFILGDTTSEHLSRVRADAIVINMVLHHTADPAEIILDVAAMLKIGGVLVITELCSHDQAWAREFCGDLWLGFQPNQITSWCEAAGLSELASSHLAQRNGFQVQVRLYKRRI